MLTPNWNVTSNPSELRTRFPSQVDDQVCNTYLFYRFKVRKKLWSFAIRQRLVVEHLGYTFHGSELPLF